MAQTVFQTALYTVARAYRVRAPEISADAFTDPQARRDADILISAFFIQINMPPYRPHTTALGNKRWETTDPHDPYHAIVQGWWQLHYPNVIAPVVAAQIIWADRLETEIIDVRNANCSIAYYCQTGKMRGIYRPPQCREYKVDSHRPGILYAGKWCVLRWEAERLQREVVTQR